MADIIVVDNNGYVDKYEGDAIMAFWGAPVDDEHHAIKACNAALDNQKKLKDIQEYFKTQGLEAGISIRIGLNTGRVVVGMMGSQKKLNYTVIGDAVNLASRLEGANKQFGTEIMISDNTYAHVKDKVEVRELDLIRVKGKLEPTRVFELISRKGELPEEKQKIIDIYNKGLETYRNREFEKASSYFEKCLELDPKDGPSTTYLKRSQEYQKNPPPEDWDGVFVMTTK
jgi:adenylate cyclase